MSDLDQFSGSASALESSSTKALSRGSRSSKLSKSAVLAREDWDRRTREQMLLQPETRRGILKIRNKMKQWSPRFCVLRPPVLLVFKEEADFDKQSVLAVVHLRSCTCAQRVSKMEGFCFRIYHNLKQSLFYNKGLKGESLGKTFINSDEIILLAPDAATGDEWITAIKAGIVYADSPRNNPARLSRGSSSLRDSSADPEASVSRAEDEVLESEASDKSALPAHPTNPPPKPNSSLTESAPAEDSHDKEPEPEPAAEAAAAAPAPAPETTTTEPAPAPAEAAAPAAAAAAAPPQIEIAKEAKRDEELYTTEGVVDGSKLEPGASTYQKEIPREEMTFDAFEQGKGIIMGLIKQIRPGMDLSKIVLPTHILEPRSFLEKMTDYFAHIELISEAIHKTDPLERILALSRWYISGFHIMPKTVKKPYNPILGETFRCMWKNDGNVPSDAPPSQSFLICEQVSHHPPISALYACNRADGWILNGAIVAKSKFWGTSVGALLEGTVTMYLPEYGEEYVITFPSALAKGFIIGPLTMEMYGKISISCAQSGYKSTIEFKVKPSFGSGEFNRVGGNIKDRDGKTIYSFTGRYDTEVFYYDGAENPKNAQLKSLWKVEEDPFANSVQRWTIPFDQQGEFESERLWDRVTKALIAGDQNEATEGKTELEEAQRKGARERAATKTEWVPKYFVEENGQWKYRWLNTSKLGEGEIGEFEECHHIQPITKEAFENARVLVVPEGNTASDEEEALQVTSPRRKHHTSDDTAAAAGGEEKSSHRRKKDSAASKKAIKALQSTIDQHTKDIEKLTQQIRSLERTATALNKNAAAKNSGGSNLPTILMVVVGFLLLIQLWRISSSLSALSKP